tara:strand:+ start:857 stop:1183 length:327 start_codon:yes stop_codon:yes gene_type:complete
MAFKLNNPPYRKFVTSVHEMDLDDGILGKADKNGNILINKKIKDPKQRNEVIDHEDTHIQQMKDGILDYDDDNVYYKGKTYPRSEMKEGSPALAWEQTAYKKENIKNT